VAVSRAILVWAALAATIAVPIVVAAGSEYLQYRSPVYVAAGFAGVIALGLLVLQPLLAASLLPGLPPATGRRIHRWSGAVIAFAVAAHVAGLWITSPPDMIDALTFTAPTAFSAFGVAAMWALLAGALLGGFRKRLTLRPHVWRLAHSGAAAVVVAGSVAHALMIEGTMGTVSKTLLCAVLIGVFVLAVGRLRPWAGLWRPWQAKRRG
jgi:predicted ferric reductase